MNRQSVIGSKMSNVFEDESLDVTRKSETKNKNEEKPTTSVNCAHLINVSSSPQINSTSPYRMTPNSLFRQFPSEQDVPHNTIASTDSSSRFSLDHFTQLHSTTRRNDDVRENGESIHFRDATIVTREPINRRQYQTNSDRFSNDTSGMSEYFCQNGHCSTLETPPTKSVHLGDVDNLDVQSPSEVSPNANTLVKHLSLGVNSNGSANKGRVNKGKQGTKNTVVTSDVTTENDLSDDGYMDELEALASFDNGAQIFYNSVGNRGPSVAAAAGVSVADDLGDFIETDIPRRNLSNSSRSSLSNDSRDSSYENLSTLVATGGSEQVSSESTTGATKDSLRKLLDPHNNSVENNEDCLDVASPSHSIAPRDVNHSSDSVDGNKGVVSSNGSMNCVNDLSQVGANRWENSTSVSPNSYAERSGALSMRGNSVTPNYFAIVDHRSYDVDNTLPQVAGRLGMFNSLTDIDSSRHNQTSDSSLDLDFSSARSPVESDGTPVLPLSPLNDEVVTVVNGSATNTRTRPTNERVKVVNAGDDFGQFCSDENTTVSATNGCDETSADEKPVRRHSYSNMLDNIERNVASKRAQDKRVDWTMVNSFSAEDSPREYSLASATTKSDSGCIYCKCTSASSLRCYCLCHGKRTVSDDAPSTFNSTSPSSPGRRSKYVNGRMGASGVGRKRGEGIVAEEGLNWYSDDEDTVRNSDSFGALTSGGCSAYARKSYPKLGMFSRSRAIKPVDKVVDCSCWNGGSRSPSSAQVNGRQRDVTGAGMSEKVSTRMLNRYDVDINNIGRLDTYASENGQKSVNTLQSDASNQRYMWNGETWNPLNSEWKCQEMNEEKKWSRSTTCAMNAVRTVLKELNVNYDHARLSEIMINSNDSLSHSPSLTDYLISASIEGVAADDLIACVEAVTDNKVYGRFFELPETSTCKASDVDLEKFLTYWMNKGAIPLATLNMAACTKDAVARSKLVGSDAWHHQIINRIGDGMCLMDETRRCISEEELCTELRGRSTILISRSDVISRWNDECNLSTLITRTDRRWRSLNVIGQVVNMLRERQMNIEGGYRPQQTAQVTLPTHFRAGLTLFVNTGTRVHTELVNAESTFPLRSLAVVDPDDAFTAGSIVTENSIQSTDCRGVLDDSRHSSSRLSNCNLSTHVVYSNLITLVQK